MTNKLATLLSKIDRPGTFAVAGRCETAPPNLIVNELGPVAFPLLPVQAQQLITLAEPAPYGRGEDTIVDNSIRKTNQLSPESFRLEGKHWFKAISTIVNEASKRLGAGPTRAELYKLLVYEKGDFFAQHRDSEKTNGMYGTLVVALPSKWEGGQLNIQHNQRECSLSLRGDSLGEVAWGAFYTDCIHQLQPVTSGYRIVLVYNLIRKGTNEKLLAPNHDSVVNEIVDLFHGWDTAETKWVHVLDHSYSQAEFGFQTLKGSDAGKVAALVEAGEGTNFETFLAMISIEEFASVEWVGGGWQGPSSDSDSSNWEVIEVIERTQNIEHWIASDGSPVPWESMPFDVDELSPLGVLENEQPDLERFYEATGNEGATAERTYRRAAIVMWPKEGRLRALAALRTSDAVTVLESLANSVVHHDTAQDFAFQIVEAWDGWAHRTSASDDNVVPRFLGVLIALEDRPSLTFFISAVVLPWGVQQKEATELARACALLKPDSISELVETIKQGSKENLGPVTAFLFELSKHAEQQTHAQKIAKAVVDSIEATTTSRYRTMNPKIFANILGALSRLESVELIDQMLDRQRYDLDRFVVPALLLLCASNELTNKTALKGFWNCAIDHLTQRIESPLPDKSNWSMELEVHCDCEHCEAFKKFLLAPDEKSVQYRVNKGIRRHLYSYINRSDGLKAYTIRQGRPFTWVCEKKITAHTRALEQRVDDRKNLAELRCLFF